MDKTTQLVQDIFFGYLHNMLICIIYIDGDFNELLIRMLDINLNIGLVNKEREREREREFPCQGCNTRPN